MKKANVVGLRSFLDFVVHGSVRSHFVALLLVNVLLRTLWLLYMHPHQLYDFEWYFVHSVEMLKGEGYVANGHFTAYWPIGYPYFLSLLFRITGASVMAGLVANATLSVGITLLVYMIAMWMTKNASLSFLASLGYTFLPSQIEWNSVLGSDELSTFLLLLFVYLYFIAHEQRKRLVILVSGLFLGLSCDVRPIPLLFPFALFLWQLVSKEKSARRAFMDLGLLLLGTAIAVAPVTIRNELAMHHFIIVSTNGGVDLWQGTHADGAYFWSWNPTVNPLLKAGNNEILENSIGMHAFIVHVLTHPLWTVVHAFYKWFFLYWVDWNVVSVTFQAVSPNPHGVLVVGAMWFDTVVYWAWMVVCAVGFWKGVRGKVISSWRQVSLPLVYIAYNTAVFAVFPAWDRFRYPMMPLFAVVFGIGAHYLLRLSANLRERRGSPR